MAECTCLLYDPVSDGSCIFRSDVNVSMLYVVSLLSGIE
jgi:hypothetical protein